ADGRGSRRGRLAANDIEREATLREARGFDRSGEVDVSTQRSGEGDGLASVISTSGARFFFFFQAEDGIRDLTVTGVQTCALPIWRARPPRPPRPARARAPDRSSASRTARARRAARRSRRRPRRRSASLRKTPRGR